MKKTSEALASTKENRPGRVYSLPPENSNGNIRRQAKSHGEGIAV
jgi:hypothetical protein